MSIILSDPQYTTITTNTTAIAVPGKQYVYKNINTSNILVDYGGTTVTLKPDDILILFYDVASGWADLTPRVDITEQNPTFDSLTVNGIADFQVGDITFDKLLYLNYEAYIGTNNVGNNIILNGSDLTKFRISNMTGSSVNQNRFYITHNWYRDELGYDTDTDARGCAYIGFEEDGSINFGSREFPSASITNPIQIMRIADSGVTLEKPLNVGADTDITCTFGKGKIGSATGVMGNLCFAHKDHFSVNNLALRQDPDGITVINSPIGQSILIRNDNDPVAQFSGSSITFDKNTTINGSLSKSSGSFRIPHPLKEDTHELVHSFVEAPQADNIYRGKVRLEDGKATVNIDTVAGMTEGTFEALNRDIQVFTSNESGWISIRGSVEGNILTIESQTPCNDLVSWLVIGERFDEHMYDTGWTDSEGRIIVEPEKVAEEEPIEE